MQCIVCHRLTVQGTKQVHVDFSFSADHDGLAIPKNNPVDESAIDAARRHRQHPRRDVADVPQIQP
jgi:hypothetical protein